MTSAPDGSTRLVRTLTLVVFLQWMGATAIVPMLPVYIRHLGGSDALAGTVMASFFVAGVLCQYPTGRLADRIGPAPVLIGGLITYGGASLVLPAPDRRHCGHRPPRPAGSRGRGGHRGRPGHDLRLGARSCRRGRAFAAVYGGELAGMAIGPLVGSIIGVRYMRAMFLASGPAVARGVHPRAPHRQPRRDGAAAPRTTARRDRSRRRRERTRPIRGAPLRRRDRAHSGVYDICWTLLLVARGASGLEHRHLVDVVLRAVRAGGPTERLAGRPRRPTRARTRGHRSCRLHSAPSYPFIHSVPVLVVLGATEAMGFAAAMPAVQSLLTQDSAPTEVGRVQGLFATSQTACTAVPPPRRRGGLRRGRLAALRDRGRHLGLAVGGHRAHLAAGTAAGCDHEEPEGAPTPAEAVTPTLAETVGEPLRT